MESSIAEELVCSICLSLFQEPQMLRCGHNFCLSCLHSCFPGGQNKGKCPDCRRPFSQKDFTCNRVLGNLAHKLQLTQEPPQTVSEAMGICKEHNEPLKFCCKQDLVPICVLCQDMPQHQGHNFLPIISAEKYTKNQEIMTFISKEFDVFHQILNEKEQDLGKTVEMMKAENVQQMQDALHFLKKEESSQTDMKNKIKNAFEIAEYFASLRGFKQLMERVKEFQIWQPQNDDAIVSDEKDSRVNEFQIWPPQDDDDGSVSDDEDSDYDDDEIFSNENQPENENEVNFQEDVNVEDPWNWEDEEVAGAGDEQIFEQDNLGDWPIEVEDFGGGAILGGRGINMGNILTGNDSWRWGNNLQGRWLTWGSFQRQGGGLGTNRRQALRLGTNQRRGGRGRWDNFRRWQQF